VMRYIWGDHSREAGHISEVRDRVERSQETSRLSPGLMVYWSKGRPT
jgi:hypothetical protein